MPVEVTSKSASFQIPAFFPEKPELRVADIHASTKAEGSESHRPLTTSYFFLSKTSSPQPPFPPYGYDEAGIVIEGTLKLDDETGASKVLKAGDTFFITKGSVVTFNTDNYALVYKVGGRWQGEYSSYVISEM